MAVRTFGHIHRIAEQKREYPNGYSQDAVMVNTGRFVWEITQAEPHVCIKLKQLFPKIPKHSIAPFFIDDTPENACDVLWFMDRYPFDISETDLSIMDGQNAAMMNFRNSMDEILMPGYQLAPVKFKDGFEAREYQLIAKSYDAVAKRFLLGDDLGLGKTVSSILGFANEGALPAAVVCQAHLQYHWEQQIRKFTDLKVHKVKSRRAYSLPPADIYIFKYTSLSGWIDTFQSNFFKKAVFDEIQELRHSGTAKHTASKALSESVDYCQGLTATPIYNYGNEMYSVMSIIKPGCLGTAEEFSREWTGFTNSVKDPKALGSYLREQHLFLRRTRADVGRELPQVNKIILPVEFDDEAWEEAEKVARMLSLRVTSAPTFMERGEAARELDMLVRQATGVSKAKGVANYVKILLENNLPVLLAGWHRDVYDIWNEELAAYNPVMYTGSESAAGKNRSKEAFCNGETNLMIISLRSGAGLDGLQHRCADICIGELDWSPKVHDQIIGRIDRDGQLVPVTAHFLVAEEGSDPPIIDMLGLKSSQSLGITDPDAEIMEQVVDESRIKKLAEYFLKNKAQQLELSHGQS